MQGRSQSPNVITDTILMNGLYRVGNLKEAIKLFEQMKDRGHGPDMITYVTIMDVLCKEGTPRNDNRILDEILKKV